MKTKIRRLVYIFGYSEDPQSLVAYTKDPDTLLQHINFFENSYSVFLYQLPTIAGQKLRTYIPDWFWELHSERLTQMGFSFERKVDDSKNESEYCQFLIKNNCFEDKYLVLKFEDNDIMSFAPLIHFKDIKMQFLGR